MSSGAVWADGPLKLITVPSTDKSINSHYAAVVASEMAIVHNCLIRGLNAILVQGPHVPSQGQPGYSAKDVKDLLYYVQAWSEILHHHHTVEEEVLFPGLEKLIGEEGSMNVAVDEHELFHSGLEALGKYATEKRATPEQHTWKQLQAIIDSFSEPLVQHLDAEIPLMLSLDRVDEDGLKAVMKETEDAAKASGGIGMLVNMIDLFPLVLGCCDKSFPGSEKFPPFPALIVYIIAYIFSWKHRGAWRFNPSDMFGRPRPLQMLGNSVYGKTK